MTSEALKHLSDRRPDHGALILEHGQCGIVPELKRSPFQSLVQAVAHQQLNGTAANTILARFKKLFPGRKFPRPEDLAGVTDEQIRACGFSFAKIKAIRDIAEKTLSGVVPTAAEYWQKLTDGRNHSAIDRGARCRAMDGRDAADFSAWPAQCFAGGRFWCAQWFSHRLQKARHAQARACSVGTSSGTALDHRRLVSLARGRCGAKKTRRKSDVSPRFRCVICAWVVVPKLLPP